MPSPVQVVSTSITALLAAVTATSIFLGVAPLIGLSAATVATIATIFGVFFQFATAFVDHYGEGDDGADQRTTLREHVDDLGAKLRTWAKTDTFRWETYTEEDYARFDDEVVEHAERLTDLLDKLATVNKEINTEISKTLQANPRLLEGCLPPKAVHNDGGTVAYRWQGRHPTAQLTAYEWLVQVGYPLLNADDSDSMVANLHEQVTRVDVEFELEHWNEFEAVWETDWPTALWTARDADADTIWDVVEDNRELLQRQQTLIDEIHTIRAELLAELSDAGPETAARSVPTGSDDETQLAPATATQETSTAHNIGSGSSSAAQTDSETAVELETETE
jgi:hypothetical protein